MIIGISVHSLISKQYLHMWLEYGKRVNNGPVLLVPEIGTCENIYQK